MRRVFLFFCLILLSNCARISHKGYDLKKENLFELKKGLTSLENTYKLFGEPSYKINEKTWLYYGYITSQRAFLQPRIKEENIIIVSFNKENTIHNLIEIQNKNPKLSFRDNKTKQHKKDSNFFKDLLQGVQVSTF